MKKTRRLLILLFVLLFAASGGWLLYRQRQYAAEARTNAELAGLLHAAIPDARAERNGTRSGDAADADAPGTQPEELAQFAELRALNEDLAGWLSAEGIGVDLPVVYTPGDQNHYLHLDYYGNDSGSGTLFLAVPWSPDGNHAIIYGHHMRDGSMFGRLSSYASEDFGKENPVIHFDTLYETGAYELVAAFYSKIYTETDGDEAFRYYDYPDLSDPEDFAYYVREVRAAALYDTGVVPVYGDRLLTLSTCEYHTAGGRFVVVARLIRETP